MGQDAWHAYAVCQANVGCVHRGASACCIVLIIVTMNEFVQNLQATNGFALNQLSTHAIALWQQAKDKKKGGGQTTTTKDDEDEETWRSKYNERRAQ